jgi:hypothetical protein
MVKLFNNPALHEEPISRLAAAIPLRDNESLLKWIEGTGRFTQLELNEPLSDKIGEDIEEILETSDYLDKEEEEEWDQASS